MDDFMKFMSAIRDNNLDATNKLYKSEFINMVDEFEETALHCACSSNNVNIVRFLLNKGWNIEFDDKNKCRPLHIAIMNGRIKVVNVLIKGGCLLEERNKFGYTPLDLANRYRRLDCTEVLNDAITRNNLQPSMEGITNKSNIGQGHFRHVFKYYDSIIKKYFVMEELSRVSDNRDCYGNNIKMVTKKFCHPNIVRYYGVKKDEQCLHVFTEYLPGGSIRDLLNKNGPLTERHVGRYTKQILDGLSFLHDRNIIQRDIKCSSILRDIRDNVKINVLWSRQLEGTFTNDIDDKVDLSDAFYGIFCSAPEVIVGNRHTFSADVWTLGVAVVEMLTGKRPNRNSPSDIFEAMLKIASSRKIEYTFVNPISAELQSFIDQTLSPDAKNRPSVKTLLKSDFIDRYTKETGQEIIPVVTSDDENTNQDNDRIIPSNVP